ncbi:MAG: hypothetical protein R2991_12225 [Thermoanaerobaculia bacterium]
MTGTHARIALLVDALDRAFHRPSWHGPNLRSSLRGVDLEQAAWRPNRSATTSGSSRSTARTGSTASTG